MSFISNSCSINEKHDPHWITKPPAGVMGGHSCLGEARVASEQEIDQWFGEDTPSGSVQVSRSCPQCGHEDEAHWPDHQRPITACGICLDTGNFDTRADGVKGLCCYPAESIRSDADSVSTQDKS